MGAGASTLVSEERARPLDASDVATPRGASALVEVRRLRAMLAVASAPLEADLLAASQLAALGDFATASPAGPVATPPPQEPESTTLDAAVGDATAAAAPAKRKNTFLVGPNEDLRVRALHSLGILDTPPTSNFDRITAVVQRVIDVPMALVSLVDNERQWFKSNLGLGDCFETHRNEAFCSHAILPGAPEVFVVLDATKDPRFKDNALVTGPPFVRFYAGAPIKVTMDGVSYNIGTVCAIHREARAAFQPAHQQLLVDMAAIVADEIELASGLLHRTISAQAYRQRKDKAVSRFKQVDNAAAVSSTRAQAYRSMAFPLANTATTNATAAAAPGPAPAPAPSWCPPATIPMLGFGTARLKGVECSQAVCAALLAGYSLLDTALLYDNLAEVGEGIKASRVDRSSIFVATKVGYFPPGADRYNQELLGAGRFPFNANNVKGGEGASVDLCLQQLGLASVDLLLAHNPCASAAEFMAARAPAMFELQHSMVAGAGDAGTVAGGSVALGPGSSSWKAPLALADGTALRPVVLAHRMAEARAAAAEPGAREAARSAREVTWRALEAAQARGQARFIGVSNYTAELLEEMAEYATVMPCTNEVEFHPRNADPRLAEVCDRLGVRLVGYGLLAAVEIETRPEALALVQGIAAHRNATARQVVLAWARSRGVVALARTADAKHLEENLRSLDVTLSPADVAALDGLHQGHPYYWHMEASSLTLQKTGPD